MVLFHCTNLALLQKYIESGQIDNPVRAWRTLAGAVRFSKQTDRKIILRLAARKDFRQLGGHQNEALVSDRPYRLENL